MGLIGRVASWLGLHRVAPATPIGDLQAFEAAADGLGSVRGADHAVRLAAVHACWKVISETVATLPCHLYVGHGRERRVAADHPLAAFVATQPGETQTLFELWELCVVSMCASGRSARQIVRDGRGEIIDLRLLDPVLLEPVMVDGEAEPSEYVYRARVAQRLQRRDLWLCSYWLGLSPLSVATAQLEQAHAVEAFARTYFSNGTVPGGILEVPGSLTEEQRAKLRAGWDYAHGGPERAHRVAILSGGVSYKGFALNNADAQVLESRRYSLEDIARIYRVPLAKLQDLTRATYNNVEQQDLSFAKDCITPWVLRLEQSLNRDLLTSEERAQGYYFAFALEGLLRGDYATRMNGHATAIQNGIRTPNECRALEDLPPLPGGDELLLPLNMRPGGGAKEA